MGIFFAAIAAFALAILIMSIGVIFSGRCIRGSCGGEEILGKDGELLNCDTCPVRKERDSELRRDASGTRVSLTE